MARNRFEAGLRGEALAEDFLRSRGYSVLEKRYRNKLGEIDLIVRLGDCVAFTEVKYRAGIGFGYPREAVGIVKQRRIKRCAEAYIVHKKLAGVDFRFDVIEILDQGTPQIEHIENAFW